MSSWSRIVVVALVLAETTAFTPSANKLTRVALRATLEPEPSLVDVSDTTTENNSDDASSPPPKVSKFTPRAREAWATSAGYGRYADAAESEVYPILMGSPLAKIDALVPFIEKTKARPPLLDGTQAGDCGFDPMGYCKTEELQYFYLESEVKHGRLAMLACLGWVGAELNQGSNLASGGRAPNLLNGELFDWQNLIPTLVIFAGWSYFEHQVYPSQYIEHTPNNGKYNYQHYMDGPYVAGNLDFDPLNLYKALGDDAGGRKAMRELEVQHGRTAMLGLTSWVLLEALTGAPVTDFAAIFFKPFWQWGLPFIGENAVIGTIEFAAIIAAAAYAAYSRVMEIDSMKYQGDGDPDFTMFD